MAPGRPAVSTMPDLTPATRSWILRELADRERAAQERAMVADATWIARNPFPIIITWSPKTCQLEVRAGTTGAVKLGTMTDDAAARMDLRFIGAQLGKLARNSWRRTGAWPDPPPNVILGDG